MENKSVENKKELTIHMKQDEKNPIILITSITERLKRDKVQVVFEEIMTEELPKLLKDVKLRIHKYKRP